MSERLTPCPGCARHVLVSESTCPFCREPLSLSAANLDPIRRPARRLGRAAIFAFGTVTAAGCSTTHSPTDGSIEMHEDGSVDAGSVVAAYGAPIDAGGASDAGRARLDAGEDAGEDAGNVVAAYGGPFLDGGISPPYGIPPDPDTEPSP